MLIIKCSCGRFSTLDSNFFEQRRNYKCPNCEKMLGFGQWDELQHISSSLDRQDFKLYSVPDDTVFDFNFKI